jgi:putative oxidoreductase
METPMLGLSQLRRTFAQDLWPLVPLRLIVGFGFAAHGYAKLARGPEQFAPILDAMGVPFPSATAWATSLLEFLGGSSIMLGALTAPLAIPMAVIMATAMFGVHAQYGFSSVRLKAITAAGAQFGPVGYEVNLLYLAALVTLAASGSTPFSIDRWLESRRQSVKRLIPVSLLSVALAMLTGCVNVKSVPGSAQTTTTHAMACPDGRVQNTEGRCVAAEPEEEEVFSVP